MYPPISAFIASPLKSRLLAEMRNFSSKDAPPDEKSPKSPPLLLAAIISREEEEEMKPYLGLPKNTFPGRFLW